MLRKFQILTLYPLEILLWVSIQIDAKKFLLIIEVVLLTTPFRLLQIVSVSPMHNLENDLANICSY